MAPWLAPQVRDVAVAVVFALSYFVFAAGRLPGTQIRRSAMAVIGAAMIFLLGTLPARAAIAAVDFPTLVLLFAMMIIAAALHRAGFFDWIVALIVARVKPGQLLPAVIFTAGILSAFLVNDVVCLVLAPLVLQIAKAMRRDPVAYLLALATASNIGGLATITGNPQDMLIASVSGIGYRAYLFHLAPVAIAGLFVDWAFIQWLERPVGLEPAPASAGGAGLPRAAGVMAGTGHSSTAAPAAPVPASAASAGASGAVLGRGAGHAAPAPAALPHPAPAENPFPALAPDHQITRRLPRHFDRGMLPALVIVALVLAGFLLGVPPAVAAISGAALLLISRRHDAGELYRQVDWSLLLLFIGLFLIIAGAEQAHLLGWLAGWAESPLLRHAALFTGFVALLSNLVSNVPAVMLLRAPVAHVLHSNREWLLLAAASTLGGNLTITGSIANFIVVEGARPAANIGFWRYLRVGAPIAIATLVLAVILLHFSL
jgi:Na+/H+ antiporter NhaD/arsenite permease-like protein